MQLCNNLPILQVKVRSKSLSSPMDCFFASTNTCINLQVRALIQSDIRPVVRHVNFFAKDVCFKPSATFNTYAYNLLNNQSLVKADFNPCEYIPQIQMAMNYSSDGSDNITSFADLVSLSKNSSLYNQLQALWGNQSEFSGEFLLDSFGDITVSSHFIVLLLYICESHFCHVAVQKARRFISFIKVFFDSATKTDRRRLAIDDRMSESVKRGSVVKQVRHAFSVPLDIHRSLAANETNEPIISFALSEDLSMSLDFNFGDGEKELLFGLQFRFQSGNEAEGSIKKLLELFLQDTVGDKGSSSLNGFNFADQAATVVEDLINSLIIGIDVDIDIQIGLDLTNVFNKTAQSRLPSPFLQLNTFDVEGYIGFTEWSTEVIIDTDTMNARLLVTEASALMNINFAIIGNEPLMITSAGQFLSIISPTSANGIGESCSIYGLFIVTLPLTLFCYRIKCIFQCPIANICDD